MNFFEHQAQARRNSRWLTMMFLLAVAGVVAGLVALMLLVLSLGEPEGSHRSLGEIAAEGSGLLTGTAIIAAVIIGLTSLFKTVSLGKGGAAVAQAMGAEPVPPDSRDPQLRRLRNVVEEMAIASGVPVPAIYWMPGETGINAFAAGYAPADAAIAVTRGALDKLTRDELQGVIAHEFSHVLNGDMRLNIRMMGLLFGILVIAIAGRKLMRLSLEADDARAVAAGVAAGLAMTVVGYIGYLFGQLIRAGVSRSREYLADASSVQFTRQTSGIAGALKKLAGVDKGGQLDSASREDVSHMLFGDGVGYASFFATHPPLFERIRKLEPGFQSSSIDAMASRWNAADFRIDDEDVPGDPVSSLQSPQSTVALRAADVGAQVATPTDADLRLASVVHRSLPDALVAAARDTARAPDLLCALLLDPDELQREAQLQVLQLACGERRAQGALALAEPLADLHPSQRLPLASLAFPALRPLPRPELAKLMRAIGQMIQSDGRISLFEYCLGRLLRQQMHDLLHPAAVKPAGNASLDACAPAITVVLAALAQQGHANAAAARAAFMAGSQQLLPRQALRYDPAQDWHAALDDALVKLDQLRPMAKEMLVEALVRVLQHDGRVTVAEAELLRVVCGALRCPLPPALGEA